jgi:EF hand domain-containing protein
MNKIHMLAAALLVGTVIGAPAALAQTTTAPNSGAGVPGLPGNKSGPAMRPGEQSNVRPDQSKVPGLAGSKSGPAQVSPNRMQAQGNEKEDDEDGFYGYHPGMMGGGMMGPGMRGGRGMMGGGMGRGPMSGPMMMRMIFSLMDADGDGKLSLQEFQAAHERIFKAMDTDHDGTVTLEEMLAFMRGH